MRQTSLPIAALVAATALTACSTLRDAGDATVNAVRAIPTPFEAETEEEKAQKAQEKAAKKAERTARKQAREDEIAVRKAAREAERAERQAAIERGEVTTLSRLLYAAYPFKKQEGDASSNQVLRERAWANVVNRTEVRPIDTARMRIDASSSYLMTVDDMEYLLLARAAGEAARAGKDSFAITFVKYSGGRGLLGMLTPSFNYSDAEWIGTYEDLIRERETQSLGGGLGRVGHKQIAAVVYFTDASSARGRGTFEATPVYLNMLNERLFNGDYPYEDE